MAMVAVVVCCDCDRGRVLLLSHRDLCVRVEYYGQEGKIKDIAASVPEVSYAIVSGFASFHQ